MSSPIPPPLTDRECLQAWRRQPDAGHLGTLVARYGAFVFSSALRRTGDAQRAAEVAQAVFLVLARRARRLRKKTVLAGFLFHITEVACWKLAGKPRRPRLGFRFRLRREKSVLTCEALRSRLVSVFDQVLNGLPPRQRDAILLRLLLNQDEPDAAVILRVSAKRIKKRVASGLKLFARRLRRFDVATDADALAAFCAREGCASPLPDELATAILDFIGQSRGERPSLKLARQTLNVLAWARWRRRIGVAIPSFVLLLFALFGTAWYIDSLTGHSRLISAFLIWSVKHEGRTVPGLAEPAKPWPANANASRLNMAEVRTARDLYQTTNIWTAHLQFTREQWDAAQPRRIGALPHFLQPDGTVLLRHPDAQRSGLAGVLGFDFDWTHAGLEFGGIAFTNVAARIKGNGTYLGSLYGSKHPFKVDLNKFADGQKLAGTDELTFNNLVNDHSCLSDALAYEFFREAGVPASRTAYAYLSASVDGQWERRPLGLYVMVEAVDADFALERFGSKRTPIFKPVTYELFKHLGDDWPAYEAIYDLKTKATPEQLRRVIEFARLLSFANEEEFARRVNEFLDLEKFARYLACEVLLSNYDGFLSNGQNFFLYLDPTSNKFGIIPWDLDLSWGGFFLLGTTRERERASIWHPWVGEHRLLERVMAVEEFRRLYRAQLEDLLARLFIPGRLHQRVDTVARAIRDPIAAESSFRLRKFEQAVGIRPLESSDDESRQGANRPAHRIKRFIEKRAASVRAQLDGKSDGEVLKRNRSR